MSTHTTFRCPAVACLLLALGGIPVGASAAGAATIGVSMPTPDAFKASLRDAIQAKADASGITVRFAYAPNDDTARQQSDISEMIAAKVDALIVVPIDASNVGFIDATRKADVPVVFVNNGPRAEWIPGRVAVAIPNELVAGRLQMQVLADRMGGRGNIAIITGPSTYSGAALRTAGIKEVIQNYPNIHVVEEAVADWSRDKAKALMIGWLSGGVHIDAIAANNDEMAIGAYEGWVAAGGRGAVPLIAGVDATKDGLAAVHNHHLAVTVRQDAQIEGGMALNDAMGLIDHKPVPQYDWVPFTLVSREP